MSQRETVLSLPKHARRRLTAVYLARSSVGGWYILAGDYGWLAGRDSLIVKADRREPLVVLPLKLAAEIASAAEHRRRA